MTVGGDARSCTLSRIDTREQVRGHARIAHDERGEVGSEELTLEATRPADAREWRALLFPSAAVTVAMLVVCVLLPALLVVQQIRAYPGLSPTDEYAHLDYVHKIARGTLPRIGQRLDRDVLEIEKCAPIDYPGVSIPPCGSKDLDPNHFPGAAYNHEALQPPLYYGTTAVVRAAIETVTGDDDYLTTARVTGALWLVMGMLLLWAAGRVLRAPPWALLAALLVLVGSPAVVFYSSVVSNDATGVFAGALLAFTLAVAGTRPSRAGMVALFAAAFVGAALKPTNGFAAVTVAIFVAVLLVVEHRRLDRAAAIGWLRCGGVVLAGAVVAAGGWNVVSGALALQDASSLPIYAVRRLDGFHLDLLLAQAANMLKPATGTLPPGVFEHFIQIFSSQLILALFLGAALAGLFVARRTWQHWLGLSAVVGLLTCGLAYGLLVWASLRMDPDTNSRYGLPILPLLTLALAGLAAKGRTVVVVGAVGVVAATSTLVALR
jgi:hypothetical protein